MILHRRAFTLVELLMVMGIIAVLAAIIFPAINLVRNRARVTVTGQRAQTIITALQAYGTEQTPAVALMSALPLGGVPRFGTLDNIYAVIERGGGTGAGRRWPPYVMKGAGNTGAAGLVTETIYNNPSSPDYLRYRDTRSLFGQIQDALPPSSGAVPATWYESVWPLTWPLTNWDSDAVIAGSTPYSAPLLRYPWGRPTLGIATQPLLAYTTRSDGSTVVLDPARPIPFDLGHMSPLRSLELLLAAGIISDPTGAAWRSDRSTAAAWNDAWGTPLVVSYAIFQPDRYRINPDPQNQNERALLLDRCQERYGYNRSLYIAVGSVGGTVRSTDAGIGTPHPWPELSVPWTADKDAAVNRWLWRQIRDCGGAEEWTEGWQENRPWEGARARSADGHTGIIYAPTEIR